MTELPTIAYNHLYLWPILWQRTWATHARDEMYTYFEAQDEILESLQETISNET